jgi:replicative DNA helicase
MFDDEIEKAVLYYMIFEGCDLLIEVEDFASNKNRRIAKSIIKLQQKKETISLITVQNEIEGNKEGALEYISNLSQNIYGVDVETCYQKLKEYSKKRRALEILTKAKASVELTEDIGGLIEDTVHSLNQVNVIAVKDKTFVEQIYDAINVLEEKANSKTDYSMYTGIYDLDSLTDGLHAQELTIIGARPGMGKTTLALQIGENIASKGKYVAFISLEMSETQIINKILSRRARIDSNKLRSGRDLTDEDWNKLAEVTGLLSDLKMEVNDRIRNIQQLEIYAKKLRNSNKLDLLIIDYIQLLKSTQKYPSREQEVADISRRLKLLSLDLGIPIIALCQLNRNAENSEPNLADLRESGSIEQDADNIIFIYCIEDNPLTFIKLAKQRAGSTGTVEVRFMKGWSEFVNLVRK